LRSADLVREHLEHAIVTGEFVDGERLNETKLSARFNVSRTPLREAIHMLASSGLIEVLPRRGAFVRQPTVVDMIEMFEVMAELEALCGRLVARRAAAPQLAKIKASLESCEAALADGDSDAYYRENETFHQLIYALSGNKFLQAEASRLHNRLQAFRRIQLRVRGRMSQSMKEHREIYDAIEAGDEARAAAALRDHVAVQGEKFNDLMASFGHENPA